MGGGSRVSVKAGRSLATGGGRRKVASPNPRGVGDVTKGRASKPSLFFDWWLCKSRGDKSGFTDKSRSLTEAVRADISGASRGFLDRPSGPAARTDPQRPSRR